MKILITGDFCDRYRVSEQIAKSDYASLFADVKPIVEDADFSIVNFEFPIVEGEAVPIKKCGPNLKGQRASIEAIQYAGFIVCTLANNHILDQGEQCCINTKRLLEQAGIKTVGAGKNLEEAAEILYLQKDDETVAVINCCEHEFTIATEDSAGANPLNPIQQYYKIMEARHHADYVLVIVHGGHEYYQLPSPRMQETYRFFIDAGADAVVNHHQHCFSGYEVYDGKPIFYGLGNFCFDEPNSRNSIWNEGYMVTIDFSKDAKPAYTLYPYTQCNEQVGVKMMTERAAFDEKITELNRIIAGPPKLQEATETYYDSCSSAMLNMMEPYSNRLLNKLYRMGLLPTTFKGKHLLVVYNHIRCEAHFDKMDHAICHKIIKVK